MRIAIPIDEEDMVYKLNPWTAPYFDIYTIDGDGKKAQCHFIEKRTNPWLGEDESIICDPMACQDGCSDIVKADINHLADHYIILEVVNDCDYLIARTFCSNIERVMTNSGIKIFEINPFINNSKSAIHNLVLSQKIASNIEMG